MITLRPGDAVPAPNTGDVETRIAEITRGWGDDLTDLLYVGGGTDGGDALVRRYDGAFPEAYKEDFEADVAVRDIARLEALPDVDGLGFEVYTPRADDDAQRRLKVFRTGSHISLAKALPMFGYLGVEVLDERPYELERRDGTSAWIYDFGLVLPAGVELDQPEAVGNLLEALRRLWRGDVEQDGFNALVLRAGLTWRQVTVLRAYAKYLRQVGTPFSQGYIEQTLVDYPLIARGIVELFELRFDPARHAGDGERDAAREAVLGALGAVASLDQDRILRFLLGLVEATLRTNVFRPDRLIGAEPTRFAPDGDPVDAALASQVRGLGLLPARRGGAPALRPGGTRRPALVGSAGGFPHRGPRAREGADGQERRHRARRGQGRLRRQADSGRSWRPGRRPRRGHRLLPHLRLQPARRHRQLRVGYAGDRGTERGGLLRRRGPLSGRGRGQGHRDVLRHRQRDRRAARLLARRRLRVGRLRGLRPQGDGHHGPRSVGVGQVPLPRAGPEHPDRAVHCRRHR